MLIRHGNDRKCRGARYPVECNYSIDRKSGCDPVVVIEQAPQTFTPSNDALV
jgi:hypothetical protein